MGTTEDVEVVGPGGEMVVVPPHIECGMGRILAQVEDWAWDALGTIVGNLTGQRGVGLHWWAGWTGLAAIRARSTFFDSVEPTIQNQSGLAGSGTDVEYVIEGDDETTGR